MFSIIFHCINNIRQRVSYKYRPDIAPILKNLSNWHQTILWYSCCIRSRLTATLSETVIRLTEIGLASSGLGEPWPCAAIFSKTPLWSMSIRHKVGGLYDRMTHCLESDAGLNWYRGLPWRGRTRHARKPRLWWLSLPTLCCQLVRQDCRQSSSEAFYQCLCDNDIVLLTIPSTDRRSMHD